MPRPRVYIETTIPSAYYTSRTDPDNVERRDRTRRWWHLVSAGYELVTSLGVVQELADGRSRHVPARLELHNGLRWLEVTEAVSETVGRYIAQKLMPAKPSGDALHLALASHHSCDVLLTWNYRHLANVTKFDRIRRINEQIGIPVPLITTPTRLLGGEDGEGLAP